MTLHSFIGRRSIAPGNRRNLADMMREPRLYCVYIMTNLRNTVLYTGATNDLKRRAFEHRNGLTKGFTKRYNVCKLVYYEVGEDVSGAIEREKQIKGGSRADRIALVNSMNP